MQGVFSVRDPIWAPSSVELVRFHAGSLLICHEDILSADALVRLSTALAEDDTSLQ